MIIKSITYLLNKRVHPHIAVSLLFPSSNSCVLVFRTLQGICTAVILQRRYLTILPPLHTNPNSLNQKHSNLPSLDLTALAPSFDAQDLSKLSLGQVRYATFLLRYTLPVLLVLHEYNTTCPALYPMRKDSCAVTALAIEPPKEDGMKLPMPLVLWSVTDLPSDIQGMVACPAGTGEQV